MGRHVTVNRLEIQHVKRDALNNTYVCQASNTKLVPPAERTVRVEMLRKFTAQCSNLINLLCHSTRLAGKYVPVIRGKLFPIDNQPRNLPLSAYLRIIQTIFTLFHIARSLSISRPDNPAIACRSTVRPISTSIVHKPKQLVTESQITLSCEVEGSVPDTDIKWTQNNRVFERGSVSFELVPPAHDDH